MNKTRCPHVNVNVPLCAGHAEGRQRRPEYFRNRRRRVPFYAAIKTVRDDVSDDSRERERRNKKDQKGEHRWLSGKFLRSVAG